MKTCHSEYGKLVSVCLKRAAEAFSSEARLDRDWRRLNFLAKPDFKKSLAEYDAFESLISKTGAKVNHFPDDDTTTLDSIYCRDASLATDRGIILCNMGKPARQSEPAAQSAAYQALGIPVLGSIKSPGTLEGGDVAWLDPKTLAVGHTYRTNEAGIEQLAALLKPLGVDVLVAHMPHYKGPADVFHLMSVLSPVDKDLAVVYSPLMPIPFRNELLVRGYQLVEVPDAEFDSMGCNVLATGPREVLMVKGNPRTRDAMRDAGCAISEYEGQQISVLGGGGPTCLTRPLQREI